MFSSEAATSNMNKNSNLFLSNQAASFKNDSTTNYFQSAEQQNHNQSQHHHHHHQGTGLARYRSAPSSFLAALLDNDNNNNSSGDDEAETLMFSSFFSNGSTHSENPDLNQKNQQHINGVLKQERDENHHHHQQHQMGGYESVVNGGGGAVVGSYSLGMESDVHLRMDNNNNNNSSNLLRQSSSPAGFFNGFSVMGNVGSYRVQNHGETSSPANHLSNNINNFASGPSSSSRTSYMPSIPENGNESVLTRRSEDLQLRNGHNSSGNNSFALDSWKNTSFNGLKRNRDGDLKMFSDFSGLENSENGKRSTGLVHHLSLPKTASEMATAEKFLHFQQDSIQIRAKRGCATHPRSIAERMRRTRISEKMKKLQDLFPNLDKQTNTADMLDMAVEYIKELQKQVQSLTERKAKCACPNKSQEISSAT